MAHDIVVLGVFNADTTYRAARLPRIGETILGRSFALSAGGKGSNQAIAAARAGGDVAFLTAIGDDAFGALARETWAAAGVHAHVRQVAGGQTGAALVFVEDESGDNAIVVAPGEAARLGAADIEGWAGLLGNAKVVLTQLEQPVEAARRALDIARQGGARTILNPAPAVDLPPDMLALCDVVTPNQTEAAALAGRPVGTPEGHSAALRALVAQGAGAVALTLGEEGALYFDGARTWHCPAFHAGPAVETTGAGDAFNGALAVALAESMEAPEALHFATAAAALSVTRAGAAASMPGRAEIDALVANHPGAVRRVG
jgi:ribokinase